jgi:lipoprotein
MKLFGALALLFTLGISACSKANSPEPDRMEGLIFQYFPRECTRILTLPMETRRQAAPSGSSYYQDVVVGEEGVEARKFLYWMMTGAGDLDSLELHYSELRGRLYEEIYHRDHFKAELAPSISPLETQLFDDYRIAGTRSRRMQSSSSLIPEANLKPWEYRVTGVKDFKIMALTPLFGLPAETSLNHFFTFHEFKPKQIISHESKRLVWGYRSQDRVTSIAQWLSMRPMAQPVMMLRLNAVPQEVPVKTRFVTVLTTTEGKELRDTLQVLLK